jgi:dodecin
MATFYKENDMAVARITEIISGSKKSFDDAVKQGVDRANKTLKNVTGVWIKDQSCVIDKGKIVEYRVAMKVTFILAE